MHPFLCATTLLMDAKKTCCLPISYNVHLNEFLSSDALAILHSLVYYLNKSLKLYI